MADQTYFTHVTDIGVARITNAVLVGGAVELTHYAVGDGGGAYYRPTPQMTTLKNEVWRGNIARLEKDPQRVGHVYISAIIPAEVGGFAIREMGVFDADGNMIGIGNTAEVEKVASSSGMSSEIEMTMHLIVTNTDVLQVTVDPSVIIATKKDIEKHNIAPDAHGGVFEPAGSAAAVQANLDAGLEDFAKRFESLGAEMARKADKVESATAGNFAGLDASGNLIDSGKHPSDFSLLNHSHSEATASSAGFMSAADKTKLDNTQPFTGYVIAGQYADTTLGYKATAEGINTTASGDFSHAEGSFTPASGSVSHTEGYEATASGYCTHAEGINTTASGDYSHAEGQQTIASGKFSHAGGDNTKATVNWQTAIGKYNAENANALFIVGNGENDTSRSNALEVLSDGTAKIGGTPAPETVTLRNIYAGTDDLTAGTSPLATGSLYFVYE